jgi:hypothetical protein
MIEQLGGTLDYPDTKSRTGTQLLCVAACAARAVE